MTTIVKKKKKKKEDLGLKFTHHDQNRICE